MYAAFFNGADSAAVRVHYCCMLQLSHAYSAADIAANTRRVDHGYGAVFDIRYYGIVSSAQGGRTDGYVPYTHTMYFIHYHIYYFVAAAKMMVKR